MPGNGGKPLPNRFPDASERPFRLYSDLAGPSKRSVKKKGQTRLRRQAAPDRADNPGRTVPS